MKNTLCYITLFIICVIMIFAYRKMRCNINNKYKDPLEYEFLYYFDGWSVTHLVFYMLLGYLYPNYLILTLVLGALWELFEHYTSIYKPRLLFGIGDCSTNNGITDKWWYGKWSDLFVNALGFIIGQYLKIGHIKVY